jgi:hypothetical protein
VTSEGIDAPEGGTVYIGIGTLIVILILIAILV